MKQISKILGALTLSILMISSVAAQDVTSYFMTGAIERNQHNASFAPDKGYFNIPVVGNTTFSVNGNLSLDKILFSVDDSLVPLLDTRVSASDALSGLSANNSIGLSNRLTILGFGGYCRDRKSFWDFGVSLRTSANIGAPYELFEFLKDAPSTNQIRDINIYLESYAEVAFGYSKYINEKLVVGARIKALVGIANASLNIDKMDVTLSSDEWKVDAQGTIDINANGLEIGTTRSESGETIYDFDDISFNPTSPSGYGVAVDLGATYKLTDRITLSLGVNDIGMISWDKSGNSSGTIAKSFSIEGAVVDLESGETTNSTEDISFDDLDFVVNESSAQNKWLQGNVNAGVEYTLLNKHISLGAVYSARFWKSGTVHQFTPVATLRPMKSFSVAASYSLINNSANAIGLSANLSLLGFLNLYVATDVVMSKMSAQYVPIEQSNMNFSFGMAFNFGRGQRNWN